MADQMTAEAGWREGMRFEVTTGTGHEIVLDASPQNGGADAGPRPIELLLVANAGCTGMDVISILQKMRLPVKGYRVRVIGTRRDEHPRIFEHILIEHILQGDLDEGKVAHAVDLSETKYCSVGAMLREAAEIEIRWTVER